MAYLGFYSHFSEWSGAADDSTLAGSFDPNYTDRSIKIDDMTAAYIQWKNASPGADELWIHFRIYHTSTTGVSNNASADGWWFRLRDSVGDIIVDADVLNGQYGVRLSGDGGSTFSAYSTFTALPASGFTTFDIQYVKNNAGNSEVRVYEDGVLRHEVLQTYTAGVGPTIMDFEHFDMSSAQNVDFHYSEVCVADEDTRGIRVATLVPDGIGDNGQWTGNVLELVNRDTGSGIVSDTPLERFNANVSAYSGPASPASIRGVFAQYWGFSGATGPQQIDPSIRIGTTNYDIGTPEPLEWGVPLIAEWANDPATTSPWITTAFASFQIGAESNT